MNSRPETRPVKRPPGTAGATPDAPGPAAIERHLRRRDRELSTILVMIRMYCRDHHAGEPPCDECAALANYARRRLERCVFGAAKPTCANCSVHCYSAEMRERVRTVMRYAGPRMLLRHPVLGIAHMLDGRRPAPELPARVPKA
jgi:Nitrous oxide-stimulated promoter